MAGLLMKKLAILWQTAQVELRGAYSIERIQALFSYSNRQNGLRIFIIPLITPLPSLILVTIIDLIPLRPTTEGVHANRLFFARAFISFWIATAMTYTQFKHIVDRMPLLAAQIVLISALVAFFTVAAMYALAIVVGFPLPFSSIMVSPVWLPLVILPLVSWIKQARVDPTVWPFVVNSLKAMACQEILVVIYPTYFYIFTMISESWKPAFALLSPILKLVLRNIMAQTVVHLNDEVPEIVILNVEVFSALFVAYCMQNTSSVKTTCVLMAADALQMCASLLDIGIVVRRLKTLRRQISTKLPPVEEQRTRSEFSLAQDIFNRHTSSHVISLVNNISPVPTSILKMTSIVQPSNTALENRQEHKKHTQPRFVLLSPLHSGNEWNGPRKSKALNGSTEAQYVEELRKVLYLTEFVVLLNYVEVVIPLIYGALQGCIQNPVHEVGRTNKWFTCLFTAMYLFTIYHLPNRVYYEHVANMDHGLLRQTLFNLLLYAGLQLLSLIILNMVIWYKMRFSVFRQLAFVLERQCSRVQNRLIFWVYYNVQSSLAHCGYDYTFKFAWLWKKSS